MKFNKIFAIASAAVLMVACGGAAVEGSKEVRSLLPSKSQVDSASYLIGVNFGSWIKGNNFGELNYNEIIRGIKDWQKAEGTPADSNFFKQFKVDPNVYNEVMDSFVQKRRAYSGALNTEKGEKYMAQFMTDPEAAQSESGLAYKIIEPGSDVKPLSDKDTVWVNYKGTLVDGTVFDQNDDIHFTLRGVIKGWAEGLKLIGEGGKILLVVPSDLGYGEYGSRNIQPNSTLVFDVELKKVGYYVEPAPAPAPETPAKRK